LDVKAVTDTECIATSYDEFITAIQKDPQQAVQFMQTLVRRLRRMKCYSGDQSMIDYDSIVRATTKKNSLVC
jgi:CRP-like cAMP-binding protein